MEDTLKILKGIAHYYESTTASRSPEGILRQAVLLSERYITDRFLPDKAIDLIDEACSDLNLHDKNINRSMELRREIEGLPSVSANCCRARTEPDFERLAELFKSHYHEGAGGAGCALRAGHPRADDGQSRPRDRAVDEDTRQRIREAE